MKLELKHLAPYLPYGLKVFVEDGVNAIEEVVGMWQHSCITEVEDTDFELLKPILRPLSDLTKEIEHNGERVCLFDKYQDLGRDLTDILDDERWVWEYPYHIVSDLLAHHFDVFGLIDKNLAIDLNTIDQ